ncbi:class I adenylate-forming enzyme family protein [Synechococcus sp. ROS8604]|uniref:class I adenylate-forming enzyme family protein n=1 Tax=Synechococcus sp. ROS8604 TaxID=1442557 RepID=UPI002104B797|nr:class I adenylate-forming enzyme family protein [Synechococcus sp. ROS8604]
MSRDPDAVALHDLNRSMSWAELEQSCHALAKHYLSIGLCSGDRIASLMPNSLELLIHYLAGLRCGLVLTPLNYRYTVPEINHALDVSGARCLIYHCERQTDVDASNVPTACDLGCITTNDYGFVSELSQDFADLSLPQTEHDPDQPCFLFFTSGSTGKPKGVTHTRQSLGWMFSSVLDVTGLQPGEQYLAGSSLSHIASSTFALAALCRGASVLVPNNLSCSCLETLLRQHHPQVVLALPVTLFSLVRDERLQRSDFSSVRLCISGGDKVNHQLHVEFEQATGQRIDECYGMSEIGFASLSPIDGENRIGSVGKMCPGFEGCIRSSDGRELSFGEEGVLWVKSPTLTVGYWNNPAATAETIQKGWLNTGDAMRLDDDGYLWFCGRRKQIIVHDGSNICPQDVEEALMEHPAVDQAGVIGIEDDVHGQNVHAYVSFKTGCSVPTIPDLISFTRDRVGYKAPEVLQVLPTLPLNSVGKINRVALHALISKH